MRKFFNDQLNTRLNQKMFDGTNAAVDPVISVWPPPKHTPARPRTRQQSAPALMSRTTGDRGLEHTCRRGAPVYLRPSARQAQCA